jgi:hypothetical protein
MKHNWIVASFFTAGTPYATEAGKLIKSCRKHNIPHVVAEYPNLKSWWKNHHQKPAFLLHMMNQHPDKNIVWIDCDAVFNEYPELFNKLEERGVEFACHFRNWKYGKDELLTGTMYLKNCELIHELLKRWMRFNRKMPNEWGQRNLQRVYAKYHHLLRTEKLPIEYCTVFDDERIKRIDPVITHYQASRKYRNRVKNV